MSFLKTSITPVSPIVIESSTVELSNQTITVFQSSDGTTSTFSIEGNVPLHIPACDIPQLPNDGYHMPGTTIEGGGSDMGIVTMGTTVPILSPEFTNLPIPEPGMGGLRRSAEAEAIDALRVEVAALRARLDRYDELFGQGTC